MIKVVYTPYTELILHEITEQEEQVLLEEMVRQALASQVHAEPSVNWVDGVAFVFGPMPATDEIVKEGLAGRLHYASVMFTRMAFQARVSVKVGNQDYGVRMRKVDRNPTLAALGRFLKDFKTEAS